MDFLRRAAKTWVAKLLLILLVLSFGVWGISGSLLNSQSTTVVAVGDEIVGPNEFLLAYQQTVGPYSQQIGRRLSAEEARSFGIEEQVFSNLAANAALNQQAIELNLGLSKQRQAEILGEQEIFYDRVSGQFDQATFRRVLQNVGMTESQYLATSAKNATRTQIAEAVSDGIKAPKTLLNAIAEYRSETRDIDYITLNQSMLDPIGAPTDTVLATYFDENIAQYAAPEFRKIAYVRLLAADIMDLDAVSIESMQQEYEARKSNYVTEETRSIDQLTFQSKDLAEAALAKLASGLSFDALVIEEGKTASDVSLGTFSKATVPDQSLADAAFAVTTDGGTSPVVEGTFGQVIMRITDIKAGSTQSFDDVKDDIREQLALIAASETLFDVHDAYEDDRGSGMTLIEAATKQNLPIITIDKIDASGLDENGNPVEDIPQSRTIISQAFDADVGLETPPITIGGDGFVWFEVLDVIAARDRTLDEVKDQVVTNWTEAQTATALTDKAVELKKRLDAGEILLTLGDELGISVGKKIGVTRTSVDDDFGGPTLQAAFAGPDGLTAISKDASGSNEILMKIVAVAIPDVDLTSEVATQTADGIGQATSNEIMIQLIGRLQNEYGVSVNRSLASQILSQN
jgi:peptidyl-prolyl cis-trans isomerase D